MTISEIVARVGIIDKNMSAELRRWGFPIIELPEGERIDDPDVAIEAIQEAIESEEQIELRTTDLDVFRQFMETRKDGKLHLVVREQTGEFSVSFGRMKHGDDYIIPWNTSSIEEFITNGDSYLIDGRRKIYFSACHELFYGDVKAFMICTPAEKKHGSDNP